MFVLRGVLAIIFGIVAWIWPGLTVQALIWVFGAYSIVDGVFALIAIFSDQGRSRWFALLLEGILGIVAGVIAFALPVLTALTLVWVIGAWAVITGILKIITAVRIREVIDNEWWMGLSGVASIIFGILLFIWPAAGALALTWLIGIWSIIFGVFLIALGFRLRSQREVIPGGTDVSRPAGV
jgi:uncharacterized membrane protein HdeD (DUF308 family)